FAALAVFLGIAAAEGIDPLVVGGDIGPVAVDFVAAVGGGGVDDVTAAERVEAAVDGFVSQLDAVGVRRVVDFNVPVGHTTVDFDLTSHALSGAGRVAAIDLEQSQDGAGIVPLLGEGRFGPLDAVPRDRPDRLQPVRVTDNQNEAIFFGRFLLAA